MSTKIRETSNTKTEHFRFISYVDWICFVYEDVKALFIIKFRLGMSLTKQKDSLIRERDRLTTEVDDLNKKLLQSRQQTDAVEKRRLELEEKCRELYKLMDVSIHGR